MNDASGHIRITSAYCQELDEVLSITEARMAYFSQPPQKRQRFHFYCAELPCRSANVVIVGKNYDKHAEESVKYVVAHYAKKDHHRDGCIWLSASSVDGLAVSAGTEQKSKWRQRMRSEWIDVFDPTPKSDALKPRVTGPSKPEGDDQNTSAKPTKITDDNERKTGTSLTKTGRLERLVEAFLEARSELSKEEFNALRFRVKSIGESLGFWDYFRRIELIGDKPFNGVMYGNSSRIQKYGKGFSLMFYDKHKGSSVSLYVSPEKIEQYRFHGHLQDLVETAISNKQGVTAYILGKLLWSSEKERWQIEVHDLRHLCLRLRAIPGNPPSKTSSLKSNA